MVYKGKKIEKLYYSIGEVADIFNVNPSLIRYWEKHFDIIKPRKNSKGHRIFIQKDIENLHVIFHLVKERGMTLEGVKKKLKENKNDTIYNAEIVRMLTSIKETIIAIRDNI